MCFAMTADHLSSWWAVRAILASSLLLSGCGGQVAGADEAAIANQAESLERAANATTDQLIKQIEDGAKAEDAANVRAVTQLPEDEAAKR